MFLRLHAPRPIGRVPEHNENQEEKREKSNPYPDYEQSFVVEEYEEPENNHVISIDL
jgi:hypothetical protein